MRGSPSQAGWYPFRVAGPPTVPIVEPPAIFGAALTAFWRGDGVAPVSGAVASIADASGFGNDIAQADPGQRFLYSAAGGPNGRPMWQSDAGLSMALAAPVNAALAGEVLGCLGVAKLRVASTAQWTATDVGEWVGADAGPEAWDLRFGPGASYQVVQPVAGAWHWFAMYQTAAPRVRFSVSGALLIDDGFDAPLGADVTALALNAALLDCAEILWLRGHVTDAQIAAYATYVAAWYAL